MHDDLVAVGLPVVRLDAAPEGGDQCDAGDDGPDRRPQSRLCAAGGLGSPRGLLARSRKRFVQLGLPASVADEFPDEPSQKLADGHLRRSSRASRR